MSIKTLMWNWQLLRVWVYWKNLMWWMQASYETGQLIVDALQKGAERHCGFYVGGKCTQWLQGTGNCCRLGCALFMDRNGEMSFALLAKKIWPRIFKQLGSGSFHFPLFIPQLQLAKNFQELAGRIVGTIPFLRGKNGAARITFWPVPKGARIIAPI